MNLQKKRELIQLILGQLKTELDLIVQSAKAAYEGATHEESKAEDSHDTRGLEASYLAGAQMARAEALKKTMASYTFMNVRELGINDFIELGALVELESAGKIVHYFLVSLGGGLTIAFENKRVQVITSSAPLGELLLGKKVGDTIELEGQRIQREYLIKGVF